MRRPAVMYVAHALSAPTYAQEMKNVARARRVAYDLTKLGYSIVLPGWDVAVKRERDEIDWKGWLDRDLPIVERCDVLFRLLPDPAGRTSKGANLEVAHAKKHGIPIVYSMDEAQVFIRAWRRAKRAA